jgi:hypothetical protein
MEINTNPTQLAITTDLTAFGFGMPMGGQSCAGVRVATRGSWISATGLPFAGTDVVVRDRKDLAVQGHVALRRTVLAAYVPGFPAWSPPIC